MATAQLGTVPTLSKSFPATTLAVSYRDDRALLFGSLDWLRICYGTQAGLHHKAVLPQPSLPQCPGGLGVQK